MINTHLYIYINNFFLFVLPVKTFALMALTVTVDSSLICGFPTDSVIVLWFHKSNTEYWRYIYRCCHYGFIYDSGTTNISTRLSKIYAMSIKHYEGDVSRSWWRMSVWCYVPYNKTETFMQKICLQ